MNILTPSLFYSHILTFDQIEYGFQLLRERKSFKIVFKMED
ncbi:MAG: hypothetical protein NZ891_06700 [bacterium]|nr:hypothetical protein [bacterium]MDW8164414.1 hypothetical protein [Candidatus Omnitrophota bacterium]